VYGNRTHPAGLWPATLALKARKDTRTLSTPIMIILDYRCYINAVVTLVSGKSLIEVSEDRGYIFGYLAPDIIGYNRL